MKDKIIEIMERQKDIAKEVMKDSVLYNSKQRWQAKVDTWEQAIAIVKEVMND